MTSRERVNAVLEGKTPDRLPLDFGASDLTSIHAVAYNGLKAHLGLSGGVTRIGHLAMQTAQVEESLRQRFATDSARLVHDPVQWKPGTLSDGSPCEVPKAWNPVRQPDGSEVLMGLDGRPLAIRLPSAHWFSPAGPFLAFVQTPEDVAEHEALIRLAGSGHTPFQDETIEDLAQRARTMREETDYAIVGHFGGQFFEAAQLIRGMDTFLCDLVADPALVTALMETLAEAHIEEFERYNAEVGPYLDVIVLTDDLGMQGGPLVDPEVWRKLVKPSAKKFYEFIKSKTTARIFLHSCGSVYRFIPDLIEMGVDILNPVQVSAADMGGKKLKAEFGKDIVFWGGGSDPQSVFPMGTVDEVREEVKQRIDELGKDGGFVFAPVHNIQPDVPPENIVAMFDAALEFGGYS